MRIKVSENRQSASSGSTVVKYLADVEFFEGHGVVDVRVHSTVPEDADPVLTKAATAAIRRGIQNVVRSHRQDARIVLHELFIHSVDCNPSRYEKVTAETFAALFSM
jgi:hypothetical protein